MNKLIQLFIATILMIVVSCSSKVVLEMPEGASGDEIPLYSKSKPVMDTVMDRGYQFRCSSPV